MLNFYPYLCYKNLIMFYRTIIEDLKTWAEYPDRKPLILRGARQVGKTTAVKIFASEFDQFIYINLEKTEERRIFEDEYPFTELLGRLFLYSKKQRGSGKTLIFIDEIQYSSKAVRLLRYFYEEAKDLFVVAAGSLLESLIHKNISFPVGRVEYLALRPCSFIEFLRAMKENQSVEMIENLDIPTYAHEHLSFLFKKYTTIGGMPEVIRSYSENNDISLLPKIYDSLITSYTDDIEKYAKSSAMVRYLRHIISTVFQQAANRITFQNFGNSDYRSREMKEAFLILEKTMFLKLIYPVTNVSLPINQAFNKKPRLHMVDTGLVNYKLDMLGDLIASKYVSDVYRGKIAEHIVGQELLTNSSSVSYSLNFWTRDKRGSAAEVDYVITYKGLIIPIEVKSKASGTLKSLHQFIDTAPHNWAVRFYSEKMTVEETTTPTGKKYKLISLPHYMAGKLNIVLQQTIK